MSETTLVILPEDLGAELVGGGDQWIMEWEGELIHPTDLPEGRYLVIPIGSHEQATIDQLVFMVANACASHDMQSGPFNMLAELGEDMAVAYRRFARKHVEFLLAGITEDE